MSKTMMGLAIGLLLGVVWAFGGFGAFVLTIVLGAVGLAVGMALEGKLDVNRLIPSKK